MRFRNIKNPGIFLALVLVLSACGKDDYKKVSTQTQLATQATFTGSETCKSCHADEFADWEGSHHDLAMQKANDSTVLGDFNDVKFVTKGIKYRFFKKGADFYVNTQGEEGKYRDYKITYTFGVTPLQQYLIDFPDGRKQCLQVAWDAVKDQWYDLQPDLNIEPGEWMHWTGGSMNWNYMCADCHSTNVHKNYDQRTGHYNTTYSIIDVSCEACHGPASTHVDYYRNKEKYKGLKPPEFYMDTTMNSKELVQKCARCHSRRSQLTKFFDYKGHFLDHYNPSKMVAGLYEQDGQILDEVYVYGSFKQSKMYHNGISCRDCHNVHSLKLKKQGNALCMQCHEPRYNQPGHHFHKQDTEASQCINCHMTGRYYMGIDFRRDHSFRVPRPDQTVTNGTPNACNKCHKDKSAKWAADWIVKKYGPNRPPHFSDDLLAGYRGDRDGFYRVIEKKTYPEIIRATAVTQFGSQMVSKDDANRLLTYLNDPSPLVRNEVVLSARNIDQFEDVSAFIEPLLADSIRMVRISAARYFNAKNQTIQNESFKKANKEYWEELQANADFPAGQHEIALYYQAKGNIQEAIKAYRKALEFDNYLNVSRMNLALLEYNQGNVKEAERLYLKVTEQEPEYSYPFYMLGLLYNELAEPGKSLSYFKQACEKQPPLERAFYNYALQLQHNNAFRESVKVLDRGLEIFPDDQSLLYVKVLGQMRSGDMAGAYQTAMALLQLDPKNPDYMNLLKGIHRQMR